MTTLVTIPLMNMGQRIQQLRAERGWTQQRLVDLANEAARLAGMEFVFLAACSPNDRESCLAEAATKPSDLGVRVAVAACNRKFPEAKPWEEYQRPADAAPR